MCGAAGGPGAASLRELTPAAHCPLPLPCKTTPGGRAAAPPRLAAHQQRRWLPRRTLWRPAGGATSGSGASREGSWMDAPGASAGQMLRAVYPALLVAVTSRRRLAARPASDSPAWGWRRRERARAAGALASGRGDGQELAAGRPGTGAAPGRRGRRGRPAGMRAWMMVEADCTFGCARACPCSYRGFTGSLLLLLSTGRGHSPGGRPR